MSILKTTVAAAALFAFASAADAQDKVQLQWWHAMGGANNARVDAIAAAFNESQDKYEIVALNRGSYAETMNGAIAAFRAGEQPHIVQVFEVGTLTMMSAEGAIKPAFELMAENNKDFDRSGYLAAVTGYYTDNQGRMLSFPFNSSTPVLYYNKDIFEAAGLDPETPPTTWPEVGEMMKQVIDSGAAECGFTTAWQSWIHLENFSARHDVPFANKNNGFEGLDTELLLNSEPQVRHIQQMADWQADGIFRYGGRRNVGVPLFTGGECALIFESSAGLSGVRANSDFNFGVAQLPYWPDLIDVPKNTIIGGASPRCSRPVRREFACCKRDHFLSHSSRPRETGCTFSRAGRFVLCSHRREPPRRVPRCWVCSDRERAVRETTQIPLRHRPPCDTSRP